MASQHTLNTTVIAFPITSNVLENERLMLDLLGDIPEQTLVVFPEGALSGYAEDPSFVDQVDKDELAFALERLKAYAMKVKLHLAFGTCLFENGRWFNAACYFGPNGESFVYRKVNLAISERGFFKEGNDLSCFEITHYGKPITVAFQMCREIRFPEQWSLLARKGAQIFIYLTNAVGEKEQADVWRSHLVSRAAENQRFVLCANVAGVDQKCPSAIIDPKGYVQWEALSSRTEVGNSGLDLAKTSSWYLDQSRQDLL